MKKKRLSLVLMACLAGATSGILAFGIVPAFAASSGRIYEYTSGPYSGSQYSDDCAEADMDATADAKAWQTTWYDPGECNSTSFTLPAGYLGVLVEEFKNGSFCNGTNYYYNDSATWDFGVGGVLCGTGSGNYYSQGYITTLNTPGTNDYDSAGPVTSPTQTY